MSGSLYQQSFLTPSKMFLVSVTQAINMNALLVLDCFPLLSPSLASVNLTKPLRILLHSLCTHTIRRLLCCLLCRKKIILYTEKMICRGDPTVAITTSLIPSLINCFEWQTGNKFHWFSSPTILLFKIWTLRQGAHPPIQRNHSFAKIVG